MPRYDAPMRLLCAALILVGGNALADTKYEIKDNELTVPFVIAYESSKGTLKPESAEALQFVKGYLDNKTYVSTLRIEVHTDSMGGTEANQLLSEKRALEVAKALVAKGVDCKRLIPVGFGETKPRAENKTPEGRAQNRRTSFFNAALRGRNINGAAPDGGGRVAGDPCK